MSVCEVCGRPSGQYIRCKECHLAKLSPRDKHNELYKIIMQAIWKDGKMSDDEKNILLVYKNHIGISDDCHTQIENEVKNSFKENIVAYEISEIIANDLEKDFRAKYPANLRTDDGHIVRSKAERDIDNWFHSKEIVHVYEKHEIDIEGKEIFCDFYLPYNDKGNFIGKNKGGLYIEFWGLIEKDDYAKRMAQKKEFYSKKGLRLINIYEEELHDPERVLTKKFIDIFGEKII